MVNLPNISEINPKTGIFNSARVFFIAYFLILTACHSQNDLQYQLLPVKEPSYSVIYNEKNTETLLFYKFSAENDNNEWIILSPKGFYDASPGDASIDDASTGGASLISVKTGDNVYSL